MAFPFTKRWRENRRQRRDAQREMLLQAAKEREFKAKIATASEEAIAAEKKLNKTPKTSPEWSIRNKELIVAKGKHQMAELELSTWKTNQTFKELQEAGKSLKEKTEKIIQDIDSAREKK